MNEIKKLQHSSLQDIVTKNIRIAMILSGKLSQKELAPALGLSRPTMSQKLSGKIAWTLADIEKASSYFKVKPEALVSSQLVGHQGLEPWTDGL